MKNNIALFLSIGVSFLGLKFGSDAVVSHFTVTPSPSVLSLKTAAPTPTPTVSATPNDSYVYHTPKPTSIKKQIVVLPTPTGTPTHTPKPRVQETFVFDRSFPYVTPAPTETPRIKCVEEAKYKYCSYSLNREASICNKVVVDENGNNIASLDWGPAYTCSEGRPTTENGSCYCL